MQDQHEIHQSVMAIIKFTDHISMHPLSKKPRVSQLVGKPIYIKNLRDNHYSSSTFSHMHSKDILTNIDLFVFFLLILFREGP